MRWRGSLRPCFSCPGTSVMWRWLLFCSGSSIFSNRRRCASLNGCTAVWVSWWMTSGLEFTRCSSASPCITGGKRMPSAHKPESGATPRIESVEPNAALPGGEIDVLGSNLGAVAFRRPVAMLGDLAASVLMSRSRRMVLRVPQEAASGKLRILHNGAQSNAVNVEVASMLATGIHAVANPAVDSSGNVYVTLSGTRGQETPVSVFRVERNGEMRPFLSGIMNATGLAVDEEGQLYVSSRHEGTVYQVSPAGASKVYAEGMGIATG